MNPLWRILVRPRPLLRMVSLAILLLLSCLTFSLWREKYYGKVMRSENVTLGSSTAAIYTIRIRERCTSDPINYVLDQVSEGLFGLAGVETGSTSTTDYEYWAELEKDGQHIAKTEPFHYGSTRYADLHFGQADRKGLDFVTGKRSDSSSVIEHAHWQYVR